MPKQAFLGKYRLTTERWLLEVYQERFTSNFFSGTKARRPPANASIAISDLAAPEPTRPWADSAKPVMQTVLGSNISLLSTFTPAKKSDDSRKKAIANQIFSSAPGLRAEVQPSFASSDVGITPPAGGPYAQKSPQETIVKRQKQVVHSPRLSPPVTPAADKNTPLRRQQLSASARRPLPSASATATSALRVLQQRSFTPKGVTSAPSRTNKQQPVSAPGLSPVQDTPLFRLLDVDNLFAPAVPVNKLSRPNGLPTTELKVSSLFVEPRIASPTDLSGQTPASSSAEGGFLLMNHTAASSPALSLSGPQEAQISLRRASTRTSQRLPKTTTAATLAPDGQRQVRPTD